MKDLSKWGLVGIPDHEGVVNVGGRIGAAGGPKAFRQAFARLSGRDGVHAAMLDAGDVGGLSRAIEKNHRQAADVIRGLHAGGPHAVSVVVGGGHDHGFSHLLGLKEALGPRARLGCINIDAHLDVRQPSPLIGSGSPFYLAVEAGTIEPGNLVEFGIQRHCNAPALWEYAERRKIEVVPFEGLRHGRAAAAFSKALRALSSRCDAVAVSLDLDAAAQAFAPGVSAPQAEGFSSSDFIEMMAIAGEEGKVVSLGVFELNPEHDPDSRTSRLAATAAYHFISSRLRRAKAPAGRWRRARSGSTG